MEIKNLQVELNLFEDTEDVKSSMKMLMLLENIILDDTRRDKHGKKAIRFGIYIWRLNSNKTNIGQIHSD